MGNLKWAFVCLRFVGLGVERRVIRFRYNFWVNDLFTCCPVGICLLRKLSGEDE